MSTSDVRLALPDGLTARRPRYVDGAAGPVGSAADVEDVLGLVRTCEVAAVGEQDATREEIEEMLGGSSTDRAATTLVHDGERLVGFLWVECDTTGAESWIDVYVHPPRAELVDALVDVGREAARGHRTASPEAAGWRLRTGCYASDTQLAQAFDRHGGIRVRRFWRMRIDLATADLPTAQPSLPDGVEILDGYAEPWRRALYETETAAFADHWNHTERSYDEWLERKAALAGLDPDGWWLLTVDGTPAAVCLLDESRAEAGDGYVRSLSVLREFRGRGLAKLLLTRAFVRYRALGRRGVQLGVDSESPTGANHLYESVGMRPYRVIDAWQIPID